MGCFPACFGHWKHKETMKKVQDQCLSPSHEAAKLLPATTESLMKEEEIVDDKKKVSDSDGKCEEQIDTSYEKSAVFAHSNVKKEPTSSNSGDKFGENPNGEVEKEIKNDSESEPRKCPNQINEDCEAVNPTEITSEKCPVPEESSDSLFSLSIDSRRQVFAADMGGDREVSSPFQMNTTQLKYVEDKENLPLSRNPTTMKQSIEESKRDHRFTKRDSEKAVETSLSSWLAKSEKSPTKTSVGSSPESEKDYGDRRVLGAVSARAEIKVLREPSSGGSTSCCSGDEQLGIGTVGRYWRRRGRAGEVLGLGSSCRGLPSVCNNA